LIPFKVVIPARYASTRLPGKPLLPLAGRPMVVHVCERAADAGADEVIVATDDRRIAEAVDTAGYVPLLTATHHASGTDRIAEVAEARGWADEAIVVNLQGDEPLMRSVMVAQVASDLAAHPDAAIATLATPIRESGQLADPNVVKVVCDQAGYACYFSRAPIPWHRDAFGAGIDALPEPGTYLRHVGLYAYRAGFLRRFVSWGACGLERTESLEQLRALWHGERIRVSVVSESPGAGVDTPEDVQRVERMLAGQAG